MRILITAGPTHEHIDPVRFIGNNSSGLQGIELAKCASGPTRLWNTELGRNWDHEVVLVLGPTQLQIEEKENLHIARVTSADEMFKYVEDNFEDCDVAIFSAAVADYKPKTTSDKKIKRDGNDMTIELTPNRDIAMEMGKRKKSNQKTIGFALETNDGVENAIKKIEKKNLDFVVLNETSKDNPAFGSEFNQVTIIAKDGTQTKIDKTTKKDIAKSILSLVMDKLPFYE